MKIRKTKDEAVKTEIEAKLRENGGYCPCRLNKTPDTKCMCKEFREQIARDEEGECHCGLFVASKE